MTLLKREKVRHMSSLLSFHHTIKKGKNFGENFKITIFDIINLKGFCLFEKNIYKFIKFYKACHKNVSKVLYITCTTKCLKNLQVFSL